MSKRQSKVKKRTTDHRPPTTDHRPPTTDHRPPTMKQIGRTKPYGQVTIFP